MIIYTDEDKELVIPKGLGNIEGGESYDEGYRDGYQNGYAVGNSEGYNEAIGVVRNNAIVLDVAENGEYSANTEDSIYYKQVNVNVSGDAMTWYQSGYTDGYAVGRSDGYSAGLSEGFEIGYESGSTDGFSEGYASGSTDGYASGYDSGHTDGYSEGYNSGNTDGYISGFESGHSSGVTDGIAEQKAKLSAITITQNGTYLREDGYDNIEVIVPSDWQGGYNSGWTDGYASGVTDSWGIAYQSGYTDGSKDGYTAGFNDGYASGATAESGAAYSQGYSVGWQQGMDDKYYQIANDALSLTFSGNGEWHKDFFSEVFAKDVVVNVNTEHIWASGFLDGMFTSAHTFPSGTTIIYTDDHPYTGVTNLSLWVSGTAEVTSAYTTDATDYITGDASRVSPFIKGGSYSDWTQFRKDLTLTPGTYQYRYLAAYPDEWRTMRLRPDSECGFVVKLRTGQPYDVVFSAGSITSRTFYVE